jgi:hypothetical protein
MNERSSVEGNFVSCGTGPASMQVVGELWMRLLKKVGGRKERLFHSGTNAGWEVMRIHSMGGAHRQ